MLEVKSYDSKGIIPKPGESQENYLERAATDLGSLLQFERAIKDKKITIISTGIPGADKLLVNGQYDVVDSPTMRQHGFLELHFPNVTVDRDTYRELFVPVGSEPESISAATNHSIAYGGRNLPLTFADKNALEVILAKTGVDSSGVREGPSRELFEEFAQFALRESMREFLAGHEAIHGIRRLADMDRTFHFEELIAYSGANKRNDIWKNYFAEITSPERLSYWHPLRTLVVLGEYGYIKQKVEAGVVDKIPLPLLARMSYKEFINITKQLEQDRDIGTILDEKADKEKDAWRWQLIAELSGI